MLAHPEIAGGENHPDWARPVGVADEGRPGADIRQAAGVATLYGTNTISIASPVPTCGYGLALAIEEVIMLAPATAAIASVFVRVFPASSPRREALKQVTLFCAAGLFVSLLSLTYGLDLSPGFF